MGFFGDGARMKDMPRFTSRAEAFGYMLAYQMEEKKADPMEAAQRANEFADIIAKNNGLPDAEIPRKEGVEKYLDGANKVICFCEQHPKAVDIITGAATFVLGIFAGKGIAENKEEHPKREKIDFESVE